TGIFRQVVANHTIYITVFPAWAADVIVISTDPIDGEVALAIEFERGFAAIFPMGKKHILHMPGRMALGQECFARKTLGVGIKFCNSGFGFLCFYRRRGYNRCFVVTAS